MIKIEIFNKEDRHGKSTRLFKCLDILRQTKHSVLIAAMKSGLKKQSSLWIALKEAIYRGVQVVVFVKKRNEQVEWLQREGFVVSVSESMTLQLVVIDKKDIWYGSINFIGYATFYRAT